MVRLCRYNCFINVLEYLKNKKHHYSLHDHILAKLSQKTNKYMKVAVHIFSKFQFIFVNMHPEGVHKFI